MVGSISTDNGSDKKLTSFRLFAVLCIIFTYFLAVANTGLHSSFIWAYGTAIVFSAVGCTFYTGEYFKKKRYIVFMMFGVWFLICRWLCGNFMMMLTDQLATAMMGFVLLVALPFACVMEDAERRKYLDIISWVTVLGYSFFFVLMYWGHFRGSPVAFMKDHFEFGSIMVNGQLFMKMGNGDDYVTDYIASLCFFISLYLSFSCWNKRKVMSVLALLLAGLFSVTVILVPCRTVLMGICGALLMIVLIFLQKLKIPKIWVWLAFAVCCVAGAAFLLFGSDLMYTATTNNARSAISRLSTFSDRTLIWSGAIEVFKDKPIGLFRGYAMDDVMWEIIKYDPRGMGHMHSGFMEVLVLTGIPGTLAMIAFSVMLIISAVRVFFSKSELVSAAHKVMIAAVAAMFFMNIFDSLLFINRTNTDAMNFFFALFCGYIFEIDDKVKEQKTIKI